MKDSELVKQGDGASKLWTDKQAAAFLSVSLASIRRWRLTGFGPTFYRVGASIRYDPQACSLWLESRKSGGGK